MLKKLWCWLRNHPYEWIPICSEEDWHLNSLPPDKCSNCGCTSR